MENNKQYEDQRKNDYNIGDVETIILTSKPYKTKDKINTKFWHKTIKI